jgi:HSP20 family protein
MTLTVRYPERLMHLNDAMNRRMAAHLAQNGQRIIRLPVDVYTTDNEIVVTASVPGVNPDSIDITVEDEVLTIKGEIPARLEDANYLFVERFHGSFSRSLKLNVPVNVEATFENGILTLVLPKAEEARPKVIKVQTAK